MKIQIGINGNSSTAATLVQADFRQGDGGAALVTDKPSPGASSPAQGFTQIWVNADKETSKDGSRRVFIRINVKCPISQYNTNGTVNITTPEVQAHAVVRIPSIVAKALDGAVATASSSLGTVEDPKEQAEAALSRSITYLATLLTGQPVNYTYVKSALQTNGVWNGLQGMAPFDFLSGSYGSTRVLPPPSPS